MPDVVHELLTWLTIGAAAAWVVRHFVRKPARCDGCDTPTPRPGRLRRDVRPPALTLRAPERD